MKEITYEIPMVAKNSYDSVGDVSVCEIAATGRGDLH